MTWGRYSSDREPRSAGARQIERGKKEEQRAVGVELQERRAKQESAKVKSREGQQWQMGRGNIGANKAVEDAG